MSDFFSSSIFFRKPPLLDSFISLSTVRARAIGSSLFEPSLVFCFNSKYRFFSFLSYPSYILGCASIKSCTSNCFLYFWINTALWLVYLGKSFNRIVIELLYLLEPPPVRKLPLMWRGKVVAVLGAVDASPIKELLSCCWLGWIFF